MNENDVAPVMPSPAAGDPKALIDALSDIGVRLWVAEGRLHFQARVGILSDTDRARIRAHRGAVIAHLEAPTAQPPEIPDSEAVWLAADAQAEMAANPATANIAVNITLPGPLEFASLKYAIASCIERHSILRSCYRFDADGRIWVITPRRLLIPIEVADWRSLTPRESQQRIEETCIALQKAPFDLRTGPLMRVWAVAQRENALVSVVVHHSIFDGLSREILSTEIITLYRGLHTMEERAPLPLQFRDFAREQREWLDGHRGQPHLDYWRTKLKGAETIFWLPTDRLSPVGDTSELPHVKGELSGAVVDTLRELARRTRVTPFTVYYTAFATVLARWSANSDVSAWISHHGRLQSSHMLLIGCFMNHWILRADLSGNPPFTSALSRVQNAYQEALPHLGITVTKLRPLLNVIRKGKFYPSVIFNFTTALGAPRSQAEEYQIASPGLVEPRGRIGQGAPLALHFSVQDLGDRVIWRIEHSSHMFEEATIERLAEVYGRVLSTIAVAPDVNIGTLAETMREGAAG